MRPFHRLPTLFRIQITIIVVTIIIIVKVIILVYIVISHLQIQQKKKLKNGYMNVEIILQKQVKVHEKKRKMK